MDALQRTAYAGGIMAAAGMGFAAGYADGLPCGAHVANSLVAQHIPPEHQAANSVGFVVGLLARVISEASNKSSKRDE